MKTGIISLAVTILMVVVVAHCPEAGVKEYVLVPRSDVLIVAGFQVPVIAGELTETAGSTGGVEFRHKGPIGLNEGFVAGTTDTVVV